MEGCGGGGCCSCFGGSGGGSVEEEEEEVVKRFGHVMASECGGCDGGYLAVYILYSFSLFPSVGGGYGRALSCVPKVGFGARQ